MATHSSILAWGMPVDRGARRLQSMGFKKSDMTERISTHSVVLKSPLQSLTAWQIGLYLNTPVTGNCPYQPHQLHKSFDKRTQQTHANVTIR